MRSIAVLILVLAALGGLGYLLFMDSSSADHDLSSGGQSEVVKTTPTVKVDLTPTTERNPIEAVPIADRESIRVSDATSAEIYASGVNGMVRNEAGEPVEGATLTLAYADEMFLDTAGPGGPDKPDRHAVTDENGLYLFDNLEPADYYTVIAVHPEFGSARLQGVQVPYQTYEEQPDLVLSLGSALTGVVTDPAGNPILDATVTLGSNLFTRRASQRDKKVAKTNDVGKYVLPDIAGGTFTFMVEADGYATHVLNGLPFDGVKGRSRDVMLAFAEGIAGIVVDQRGSPIKDAFVTAIRNKNSKLSCRDTWKTESNGEFELAHLEKGDYTILVEADGYGPGRNNVVPTGTSTVTIELKKRATISGQVVSAGDGSPLASGQVLLREVIQGTDITNPTNIRGKFSGGKFELAGVTEGDYLVEASAIMKGYAPTFSAPFHVIEGEDFEGILVQVTRGAKVEGKVVDSEGRPVSNAEVSTEDRAGYLPGWPTNIIPQKVRTDSSGHFTLNALKPETYRINVIAAGFVKWTKQDLVIQESTDKDLGLITLSRGGTVSGTLADTLGSPVVGGQVFLRLTDAGVMPRRYSAKSKNDGVFTVPNVQPGNYQLWSLPLGVDGPAPGGKKTEVMIFVRDGQVTNQNLALDYSTVRTSTGPHPRSGIKHNPKEPYGPGSNAKTGGGRGDDGGKGGEKGGRGDAEADGKDFKKPR